MWLKINIQRLVRLFGEAFVQVLKRYPVEMAIVLCGCVGCIVAFAGSQELANTLLTRLSLAPLFFALAFSLGRQEGMRFRRLLYYLCWLPVVPLCVWGGLSEWVGGESHRVTLAFLAPLLVLVSECAKSNHRFVCNALRLVRVVVLSLFFANVMLGLFCAILYSTTYIFGIGGVWVGDVAMYALIICEAFVVPTLFFMLLERDLGDGWSVPKLLDVLLNYIVTPALLIYMTILYLYIVTIVVKWTLPIGGVAYLVFGFVACVFVVKALQEVVEHRIYGWFFDRFSLFALPSIVLFWIGVMRRVGEYGFTPDRVWLVVSGIVMTISLLLFLSKRTGHYLYVALVFFLLFASVAYMPILNSSKIAIRSQEALALRFAGQLGALDGNKLDMCRIASTDTIHRKELRQLYGALTYLQRDSAVFAQFGLRDMDEFRKQLSPALYTCVVESDCDGVVPKSCFVRVTPTQGQIFSVEGCKYLYTSIPIYTTDTRIGYSFADDTLHIRLGGESSEVTITGAEILRAQMQRAAVDEPRLRNHSAMQEVADKFLVHENGHIVIFFDAISYECNEDGVVVKDLSVESVLIR